MGRKQHNSAVVPKTNATHKRRAQRGVHCDLLNVRLQRSHALRDKGGVRVANDALGGEERDDCSGETQRQALVQPLKVREPPPHRHLLARKVGQRRLWEGRRGKAA